MAVPDQAVFWALPNYECNRNVFNALIGFSSAIAASPAGPVRDRALEAETDAVARLISK
jgi:hypothetical protein